MRSRAATMIVLIAATATTACGVGSVPVTTAAPTPFSAAATSTPEGFAAAECPAVVGGTAMTLKLVVPDGFASESTDPDDRTPDDVDQRLDDLDVVLDSVELIRS